MPIEPAARAAGVLALLSTVATGCSSPSTDMGSDGPSAATTTAPAVTTAPRTRTSVPEVDSYAGRPLVDHVEWTETADGSRLMIHPTRAGRDTTLPGSDLRAWQEIRTIDPDADTPGMWDQFRCHWEWARLIDPEKPTWNLEPWRPAVGYAATVDAACNPGGPER